LYNSIGCISSIEIKYLDTKTIEIMSRTNTKYEGKKYNKLLRAVIVIISNKLNIEKIISSAENPISAYLFLKYLNAIPDDTFKEYLLSNKILNENEILKIKENVNLKSILENYKDENGLFSMTLTIHVNTDNVYNAKNLFENTINEISCE
jgi:tyrosyl-tRNA synthetase